MRFRTTVLYGGPRLCDDRPSQITCHFLTRPYGLWASMRHPECSGQRRISNRHEKVWGVRVLSKLCGMEIAPVHDRVFTVAVTRPAQFNLDELFLVVRESCARKNVQRSSRTLGTESDWTTDQILFEPCVQRASSKCDEGPCPVSALSTESYWTSDLAE